MERGEEGRGPDNNDIPHHRLRWTPRGAPLPSEPNSAVSSMIPLEVL